VSLASCEIFSNGVHARAEVAHHANGERGSDAAGVARMAAAQR